MSSIDSIPKPIVLFWPGNLRVRDNSCLQYVWEKFRKDDIAYVYLENKLPALSNNLSDAAIQNLAKNINLNGGSLLRFSGSDYESALNDALDALTKKNENLAVVYTTSFVEPIRTICNTVTTTLGKRNIKAVQCLGGGTANEYNFNSRTKVFNNKFAKSAINHFNSSSQPINEVTSNDEGGEDLAFHYVREYILLGESAFSSKYVEKYIQQLGRSDDHLQSLRRLMTNGGRSSILSRVQANHFFQGEVLSGLLSPLMELGCISPRQLLQIKRGVLQQQPFNCRLRNEAIRKAWHLHLASLESTSAVNTTSWTYSYRYWRGFVQRDAFMADDTQFDPKKAAIVCIHGFGGSINQFTGMAALLRKDFNVFALDSLGFGHSEKPPVSYNQYLWRDQVVEFIDSVIVPQYIAATGGEQQIKVIVAGNSIGGFTATSVAAELAERHDHIATCQGLVLFNPSGKIDSSLSDLPPEAVATPYNGPAPELLRVFGKTVFSLLQPRIQRTCEWLYPARPDHVVRSGLAENIYRDSCDPGAADVIASGGKLPKPRSLNQLLAQYRGPVLLCQGALDPLNDVRSRAEAFGRIRSGISLDLLELGHCPMDEGPDLVAASLLQWATGQGLLTTGGSKD